MDFSKTFNPKAQTTSFARRPKNFAITTKKTSLADQVLKELRHKKYLTEDELLMVPTETLMKIEKTHFAPGLLSLCSKVGQFKWKLIDPEVEDNGLPSTGHC
jgi:predicted transcriptional regulator of viral defense system